MNNSTCLISDEVDDKQCSVVRKLHWKFVSGDKQIAIDNIYKLSAVSLVVI